MIHLIPVEQVKGGDSIIVGTRTFTAQGPAAPEIDLDVDAEHPEPTFTDFYTIQCKAQGRDVAVRAHQGATVVVER